MSENFSPMDARREAWRLHEGQLDKNGEAYWLHCARVQDSLNGKASEDALIAAALHDVIEDGKANSYQLLKMGVSPKAIALIVALSRKEGEDYDAYIERVWDFGAEAVAIKLADLHDNMNPLRLMRLSEMDRKRLFHRYNSAMRRLLDIGAC